MSLVGEDPLLSSEQLTSTLLQDGDTSESVFLRLDVNGDDVLLHVGDVKCV